MHLLAGGAEGIGRDPSFATGRRFRTVSRLLMKLVVSATTGW
jgi:hypothetical protein